MGFLAFISKLFGFGRRWNGTPEHFLSMTQYMAFKNNPDFTWQELLQWGDVLQKVMKVDLHPYKDFYDLAVNGKPDHSMVEKLEEKVVEANRRRDLKIAIYGKDADLGDDDVMKSDSDGAVFARDLIKDLSKHVNFSEEEQRKIDEM